MEAALLFILGGEIDELYKQTEQAHQNRSGQQKNSRRGGG